MCIHIYIYIYIPPTSGLSRRFRSSSTKITPLPTLFGPPIRPLWIRRGLTSLSLKYMNYPARASNSGPPTDVSLLFSFFFLLPLGVL